MEKIKRSELAKIALIASLLLLITPLLSASASMRPPILYLLFSLLIILLISAESGVLKSFSSPPDHEKKPVILADAPSHVTTEEAAFSGAGCKISREATTAAVEKNAVVVKSRKVKKCPSTPSLFFIGSGEVEELEEDEVLEDEGYHEEEGQDQLFDKAEMFIGNFYKQLKIQREESWKKIYGLCAQGRRLAN